MKGIIYEFSPQTAISSFNSIQSKVLHYQNHFISDHSSTMLTNKDRIIKILLHFNNLYFRGQGGAHIELL